MKRKFSQLASNINNNQIIKRRKLNNGFSITNVIKTKSFRSFKQKMNQEEYYRSNGSCDNMLKLVKASNKSFGEKTQSIIKDLLDLDDSCDAGHDAQKLSMDLKFEIKSSRYGVSTGDFMWQHIMEEHDYQYLILVGIDFDCLKVYLISKYRFMKLKTKGIATQQGRAEGQGLWAKRKKLLPFLTEIENKEHFYKLINKSQYEYKE